ICSIFFQPFLIICNVPAQIGSLWTGETRSTLDQMRDSDSLWRYSTPLIRHYYKNKINKIKELRSSGSSGTAQQLSASNIISVATHVPARLARGSLKGTVTKAGALALASLRNPEEYFAEPG
uniref:Uncharacterized protein n=1 Tax=Astyanax mexicanus TaxID=7994 RepID=A0A3B1JFW0_ASTMX